MDSLKKSLKKLLGIAERITITEYIEGQESGKLGIVLSIQIQEDTIKDTIFERRLMNCSKCDYFAKDSEDLKKHFRSHQVNKPHQCNRCDLSFYEKLPLRLHIEKVHDKIKRFKCPCCVYETFYKLDVNRHLKKIHPESDQVPIKIQYEAASGSFRNRFRKKEFMCHLCVWSFDKQNILQQHIDNVHKKIKRFQCPSCEHKEFNRSNMSGHIKRKHPDNFRALPIRIVEIKDTSGNQEENGMMKSKDDGNIVLPCDTAENLDPNEEKAAKKIRKLERKIKRKWTEAGLSSESRWKEAKRLAGDFPETDRYKEKEGDLRMLWKDFKMENLEL